MRQDIFDTGFPSGHLRRTFISIAKWSKAIAVLGLLYQCLLLGFITVYYRKYLHYKGSKPQFASPYLHSAIKTTIVMVVYAGLYFMFYQFSKEYGRLSRDGGTEHEWEQVFGLNLRLLKWQGIVIALTIIYYGLDLVGQLHLAL